LIARAAAYPYGEIEPFSRPRFGKPVSLSRYRPDLPAWLDAVVGKAFHVDPAQRFGDVIEFARELENGAMWAKPATANAAGALRSQSVAVLEDAICQPRHSRRDTACAALDGRFAPVGPDSLDHDPIRLNRIMIPSPCLGMTFSENRFPLFRIML
jgi:hypothetical protein